MTCIEFLILRASTGQAAAAIARLGDALRVMERSSDLSGYWILRHKSVPGDVALMLEWRREISGEGSSLGQQLTPLLAEHGMVNHAVWTTEEAGADGLSEPTAV